MHVSVDNDDNPIYHMKTILFYENNLFSKGIFIETSLQYDTESEILQVLDKSRIYEEQVGIQSTPQSSQYKKIDFSVIGSVKFDPNLSIDQFRNLKFKIFSKHKFNGT
jgi:hypothetical protein